MSPPAELIRVARTEAGLTQAELARRMGTTQTAVARLERRGANPTVRTLSSALEAAGRSLTLGSEVASPAVDEQQLRAHLRLSPTERVRRHAAAYRATAKMMARVRP